MQLLRLIPLAIVYSQGCKQSAYRGLGKIPSAQIDVQDWIEPAHPGGLEMKAKKARAAKKLA
jgi:hypothetical protein